MSVSRPVSIALALSILCLWSSPGSASRENDPLEVARVRLTEAHWTLGQGIFAVDHELGVVADSDSGAERILRLYRRHFNRQLAKVRSLEERWRPVLSVRKQNSVSGYLDEVDEAHLKALRLSSNFESYGLGRVAELTGYPSGVSHSPTATSSCYGSIAGTVQGPGGPLDGVLVTAYTAEGVSAGNALTLADGSYSIGDLLAGEQYYVVTSNADALIDEVFDNVICTGGTCDPTIGSPVGVSAGLTVASIDFMLAAGGTIGGALTSQPGPLPLPLTVVNVFDATGELVTSALSDFTGLYVTEAGLPSGTYYVVTTSLLGALGAPLLDELYSDIPCPAGVGCDPTSGTPVVVSGSNPTSGVDIELGAGGNITGNIIDSTTAQPLAGILVGIHDDTGFLVAFGQSDPLGDYTILSGLPSGNFFAATGNLDGYADELYDGIPCTGGLCAITSGSAIAVTQTVTTSGIDFAIAPGGTFSGRVVRADDGSPLADVFVLGHTAAGDLVGTAMTDTNGDYILLNGLGTGSYRATTLNPLGLDDQLFNGLPCAAGSCDVTVGTPIAVTIGLDTPGIDFTLPGGAITSCSFEGCSGCGLSMSP